LLESVRNAWDIPSVKLISDSRGRLYSPTLFPPGSVFEAEPQPDGSVRIVQLREMDVPVVKPVRKGGRLMLPVVVDREVIVSAIKADRER
jgi:hypothetical protein